MLQPYEVDALPEDYPISTTHKPDPAQPGLWAHSHNAENDLMKKYIIWENLPAAPALRLGVKSFDTLDEAKSYLDHPVNSHRRLTVTREY